VAGATARSRAAVLSIHRLCEVDLQGDCDLQVIDIYQQPALARANQIVATPTLVQECPRPLRRFIGNFADIGTLFTDLALVGRKKTAP
jgi:circadian clock protein KaiB